MNNNLNRRQLLRGLGGAIVAAPFLSSVAERTAKAAGETVTTPQRLIVMYTHYGCLTNRWFPAKSHGQLTKEDYMGMKTLAPMAPYADKLLMVRGVRAMNEWSFAGTYGATTDPHTQVCGSYFTCYPVTPMDGKFTATPTGRSLDHVVAEQINPSTATPLFMQIGGVTGDKSNSMPVISYDKPGQIFPGYGSPGQIFSSLTNLFASGMPMSADTYKVARGKSVIDIVKDDLASLQRVNMSGSDQKKLQDWVDLLHQTSTAVSAECSTETATKLGLTTSSTMGGGGGLGQDISKTAPLMMDLAVLTAICDANRAIFMKYPPNYVYSNLGLTVDSHGLSHRIGTAFMGGSCVDNVFELIAKIDLFYAQQFAYLVGRLDSFAEGDKTLLDNSATVWFQEMSDGDSHNLNNLPILQAGSAGGYFKTGWAVNVDGGKADLTVGHSEDECKDGKTASNLDAVGTPADQGSMPINKYFCNLMNAVGVKAGPDGFPLKGGTAPVTHYGKYDDTKLFTKGDQPVTIAKPGEYAELRAGA
jgi:uncharacterized protein DUF1552